jgi:hypothetical protein
MQSGRYLPAFRNSALLTVTMNVTSYSLVETYTRMFLPFFEDPTASIFRREEFSHGGDYKDYCLL